MGILMRKCITCNKDIENYSTLDSFCQKCYKYFRNGGTLHTPPQYGEIGIDDKGYYICHICGMSYKKLGNHIYQVHEMTTKEYKKKFGLEQCARLTEESYHNKMHNYTTEYFDKVVKDNLIKKGEKTRFKNGDKGRTKDKIAYQTMKKLKKFRGGK